MKKIAYPPNVEGPFSREVFLETLWYLYELTGADTDGDCGWHCTDLWAIRATIDAVEQLRKDYDEVCDASV